MIDFRRQVAFWQIKVWDYVYEKLISGYRCIWNTAETKTLQSDRSQGQKNILDFSVALIIGSFSSFKSEQLVEALWQAHW